MRTALQDHYQLKLDGVEDSLDQLRDLVSNLSNDPAHVIISNRELPDILKVTPKTILSWRSQGLLGYSKVGREVYYRLSHVIDMLDNHFHSPIRA